MRSLISSHPNKTSTARSGRLRVLAITCGAVLTMVACGPKKPVKARQNSASTAAHQPPTGVAVPGTPVTNVTPTAAATTLPTPATVAAPTAPPSRGNSVALFFSDKGSEDFALPTVGKPTRVRATAIDGHGHPLSGLKAVAGSRLLLVAARSDLSWVKVLAPSALNGDDAATHTFGLTFRQAGPHMLLFVFQPKDGPLVVMPSYVKVQGERKADSPPGGAQSAWKGRAGIRAKLLGNPLIDVCKPTWIASSWTRRGKALRVAAVTYLALAPGARDLQVIAPSPTDPLAPTALPKATVAKLRPTQLGSTVVLAVTRVKGRAVVARFDVVVGGTLPKGGCAP